MSTTHRMSKNRKSKAVEKNIQKFSNDVKKFGGYLYTHDAGYSSIISNEHITNIINSLINIKGKKVYDIGCGDGTYTKATFAKGKPSLIIGIDPATEAINVAKKGNKINNIKFEKGNIYQLSSKKRFDVAIVRGVLHHLYHPEIAISQVSKIANIVVIIEPNGYNPILKLIEKYSKYHIEHEEKSYPPYLLNRWIKQNGGLIIKNKYAGIVPFFCPDFLSRILLLIQPVIESLPLINKLACASYYVVYEINKKNI